MGRKGVAFKSSERDDATASNFRPQFVPGFLMIDRAEVDGDGQKTPRSQI